jgi:hypothetical protein
LNCRDWLTLNGASRDSTLLVRKKTIPNL